MTFRDPSQGHDKLDPPVEVRRTTHDELASLVNLLDHSDWRPHYALGDAERTSTSSVAAALLEELRHSSIAPASLHYLAAWRQAHPVGVLVIRELDWDSGLFGFKMVGITDLLASGEHRERFSTYESLLAEALHHCEAKAVRHISVRVDTQNIACLHALETSRFDIIENVVTWSFDLRCTRLPNVPDEIVIRPYQPADREDILEITRDSFRGYRGRYHLDPRLDRAIADEVYVDWARKSCDGYADQVYVAESDGSLAGMITCKMHRNDNGRSQAELGELVLGCIGSHARGKGIYSALIVQGLQWCQGQGATIVAVTTNVNNLHVQWAWCKLGFRLTSSRFTFHRWLTT